MTPLKQSLSATIIFFSHQLFAQLNDLARIDYTTIPKDGSDIAYSRIHGLFNYLIKLKKEDEYLLLGLDYSNIDLRIEVITPINDKDIYNKIRNIISLQLNDNVKSRVIDTIITKVHNI